MKELALRKSVKTLKAMQMTWRDYIAQLRFAPSPVWRIAFHFITPMQHTIRLQV